MRRATVLWTIAGLLVGTAICLAVESKENSQSSVESSAQKPAATEEPQAYLGIGIEAVPPVLASQLPDLIPSGQGALIAQVVKESPADHAGLKMHDVVVAYGNQKVRSPEQFVKLVRQDKPGTEVTLNVVRTGKSHEIKVVLGEGNTTERPHRHRVMRPLWGQHHERAVTPEEDAAQWSTFDSMALTRLDDNRFRAEIKYRDKEGKVDTRTYEGTREELRKAIQSEKDMPDAERGHLLRAMGMPGSLLGFGPAIYTTPDGELIWDFEDLVP